MLTGFPELGLAVSTPPHLGPSCHPASSCTNSMLLRVAFGLRLFGNVSVPQILKQQV